MDNQFKIKGFVVWLLCAAFFLYEFLLRTVTGSFQQQIMNDLQLSAMQFSLLSTTIFLLVYGLMQIPVGIITENFGLKKTLFAASLICGLACFSFSIANGFELALFSRLLMGFGAAFGFIGLLISVNDWMPGKYIAIFIGLSQFIGTLGPMLAAGPVESLSSSPSVTWRNVFYALGSIGILLSLLILLFVDNNQQSTGRYIILTKPEKILASAKRVFARLQPWIIGLATTCIYFSIEYLAENEGRSFLILKGASNQTASNMLTISWLGFALGCPFIGFLSDSFERRKSFFSLFSFVGLIAIYIVVLSKNILMLKIGFLLLGFGASGSSLGYAMVVEQFNKNFVAVGFGLINTLIMCISALNAPLLGLVLDHLSASSSPSLGHYVQTFYILIGISLLGFVLSVFFVKETFCKSAVSFTFLKK